MKQTFPIYDTHPQLADALRAVARGWKIDTASSRELKTHALMTAENKLTSLAELILSEEPKR